MFPGFSNPFRLLPPENLPNLFEHAPRSATAAQTYPKTFKIINDRKTNRVDFDLVTLYK